MENKIVSIPLDKSKFDKDKIEKAKIFLNEFFADNFKCSFVYDNDDLCLKISKEQ